MPISFWDVASGLQDAKGPKKLGRSFSEVHVEKSRSLLEPEVSSDDGSKETALKKKGGSFRGLTTKDSTTPQDDRTAEWAPSRFSTLRPTDRLGSKDEVLRHVESRGHTLHVHFFVDSSISANFGTSNSASVAASAGGVSVSRNGGGVISPLSPVRERSGSPENLGGTTMGASAAKISAQIENLSRDWSSMNFGSKPIVEGSRNQQQSQAAQQQQANNKGGLGVSSSKNAFGITIPSQSSVNALAGRFLRHWLRLRGEVCEQNTIRSDSIYRRLFETPGEGDLGEYLQLLSEQEEEALRRGQEEEEEGIPLEHRDQPEYSIRHIPRRRAAQMQQRAHDLRELQSLFEDAQIGICDMAGTVVFPLKRLVKNKKRWPVVAPPAVVLTAKQQAATGNPNQQVQWSTVEQVANEALKRHGEQSDQWFGQKSIVSILGGKTFPGGGTGQDETTAFLQSKQQPAGGVNNSDFWGQNCLAPPYYFTLYIPQRTLEVRELLKEEELERQCLEQEANVIFLYQFAVPYWRVFLQEDCLRRQLWILEQAHERHALHHDFFNATQETERRSLENIETHRRLEDLLQGEVSDRSQVLHVEWERMQLALSVYHRRLEIQKKEAVEFEKILLKDGQEKKSEACANECRDRLADFETQGEQLLLDGWSLRLRLLDKSMKALIVATQQQASRKP